MAGHRDTTGSRAGHQSENFSSAITLASTQASTRSHIKTQIAASPRAVTTAGRRSDPAVEAKQPWAVGPWC
jgi:hypothetical protein